MEPGCRQSAVTFVSMKGCRGRGLEDLVQLARALDPEDTDVGPLANDPPEMKPLALTLQLSRALMLKRAEPLDLLGIPSGRRSDGDGHMKQQASYSPQARTGTCLIRSGQSAETGLAPVNACRKTSAYSDA